MNIFEDFVNWMHIPLIIISVFIYAFLLNLVLFKPIKRILEERKKRIEESKQLLVSANKEWEKEIAIYEQKLSEARKEGAKIREKLREEVISYQNKLLEDLKNEISLKKEQREKELNQFSKALEEELKKKIPDYALSIAEKVLRRRLAA